MGFILKKNEKEMEEWFLNMLSEEKIPLKDIFKALSFLMSSGATDKAIEWSDLLLEALSERVDKKGMLKLLELRCKWQDNDSDFRLICKKAVLSVFKDSAGIAFVESAGFDKNIPLLECLRRLNLIECLNKGTLCLDKTWGFGVVKSIDIFYGKVTIDFNRKPDHKMSFAYAGEVLKLIGNDHLLAIKHNNPEIIAEQVKNNPHEIVKTAIRSYGPLSLSILKEIIEENIISETEWKTFWDGARKRLKKDPLVDIPVSRNEPIRLLIEEKAYNEEWFAILKKQRDPEKIIKLIKELEDTELTLEFIDIIGDRLAFVISGARGKRYDLLAQSIIMAKRLGVKTEQVNIAVNSDRFLNLNEFVLASTDMSPRIIKDLLNHLVEYDEKRTFDLLLSAIPFLNIKALNESIDFLILKGKEADTIECFKSIFQQREIGAGILYWFCKRLDKLNTWSIAGRFNFLLRVIDFLETPADGEILRVKKQVSAFFEQLKWIKEVFGTLAIDEKKCVLEKIINSRGWDEISRRSVLGKLIKISPDMEEVVRRRSVKSDGNDINIRLTSWRSYRERQDQLRTLFEKDLPENNREIAVARSYGDLRENAEYKAAKEKQGLLFRRQNDWEEDLSAVRGTDFNGASTDSVSLGTCVVIKGADDELVRYNVLGEWDTFPALNIIPNKSKLAQILLGKVVGDKVYLPLKGKDEMYEIKEITGLSEEIKRWIAG